MSEEKGESVKETIADEAKALSKEVYGDVGKPVLAQVGGVAGGLVKLVLWPVKLALDTANTKLEQLSARVAQKVAKVPPERLLPPPATIAAPAALHYALLGDGDEVAELRELFENLLVASMDRETAPSVHPAFVQMIAQLTPDEAWLLKSIDRTDYAAVHVVQMTDRGKRALGTRTLLGVGTGIDETRLPQYLSNLERLGVLRVSDGRSASDFAEYPVLDERVRVEFQLNVDPMSLSAVIDNRINSYAAVIEVTPLGQQFLDTCVRGR